MGRGLAELVGRAMVDPDFLSDLQSRPEAMLAQFDLTEAERAVVEKALGRLGQTPTAQRAAALHAALLRRVAT